MSLTTHLTNRPSQASSPPRFYHLPKRLFDIAFSMAAILLLLPLFIGTAVVVGIGGGKPFFSHERIGKNGKPFKCFKFRTMVPEAEKVLSDLLESDDNARAEWVVNRKLEDDPRITRVGHFLRKSSIDELPQFANVLLGEMSVVGPRPITASEMKQYGDAAKTVTSVLPGVTGLWQVSGRNQLTLKERRDMDLAYVRSATFGLDIKIIFKTVLAVLRLSGQ